jgi:flagellar L-ring protein FlgH
MREVLAVRTLCFAAMAVVLAVSAGADSLFTSDVEEEGSLVSNKKEKLEVGEIITVLVEEKVTASTQANTDTKKESDIEAISDATKNAFLLEQRPNGFELIPEEQLPNWAIEAENEHRTAGKTNRSNSLVTTLSCTVTRVHKNGNVEVSGSKRVTVNREDSTLLVTGTIRPRDVTAANTIRSSQLADAIIELRGAGPLWNNQRRGILTKVLDWFSPF